MIFKTIVVGSMQNNCYIIGDEKNKKVIVVDPGDEGPKILNYLNAECLKVDMIILTHGHADHIGSVKYLREKTGAKVGIHSSERSALVDSVENLSLMLGYECNQGEADFLINDEDIIKVGNIEIKVFHTPGHTLGGICLLADKILITGDTLFYHNIGRTDLKGGNYETLVHSIKEKLMVLDDDVIVYPGHGSSSTIGEERNENPYIK